MSSKPVRIQKVESLIIQCQDYLENEKPDNGSRTLFTEVISLLRGKLSGLLKGDK